MIRILQCNLKRCSAAQDLLSQLVVELEADVLIISEQYRNIDNSMWFTNTTDTAAIRVANTQKLRIEAHGAGEDYVWVRADNTTYVSVYLSPNTTALEYREKLDAVEDALRSVTGELVVAGDFNARALEWGMPQTNRRGQLLLEMAARLDLEILNRGTTPTYRRPGFGNSIPDVTIASTGLAPRVEGWRVIEDYTGSDHQHITFDIRGSREPATNSVERQHRWDLAKLNKPRLVEFLQNASDPSSELRRGLSGKQRTEALVESTMSLIKRACDASMPAKKQRGSRKSVYWWTEEIAELRRTCLRLRRRAQRERNAAEVEARSNEYKTARKTLRNAIKNSKRQCWRKLCEEVDRDPWGLGYKIVTKKLKSLGPVGALPAGTIDGIVDELFPRHPQRIEEGGEGEIAEVPMFSAEELMTAVAALKSGKAPGPDGIYAEVIKIVAHTTPRLLLEMMNACLQEGVFSARWKQARLVLISKGKGDPNSPSSFRPLSLLDTCGKTLELLLRPRLLEAIRMAGDFSDRQYGFRPQRSTIGAIREVVETVRETQTASHQARPIVVLATLDVKNAFNSARWIDILEALRDTFGIPNYLLRIFRDYLKDRAINFETAEGMRTREITAGVAQGSILGPDLWNALYDGLLRADMPRDSFLVGYADDIAAVIVSRNTEMAQLKLDQVMRRVNNWMSQHGLQLALAKTEIVLLTRKRVPTIVPMVIGTERVQSKISAKYLGVILDTKLTYWPHIQSSTNRAVTKTAALSGLMANVGGPRPSQRRLLMATTHSIMLYGAEIWADAMRVKKYRKRMSAVQRRGALRIACSYRTVSEAAILVIASVPPIDLLAIERKRIYDASVEVGRERAAQEERARTLTEWQERWTSDPRGRWTHLLIRRVGPWMDRKFGEVDFYLTQFLSGHGYFRHYLWKMGKVRTPECKYCGYERDDAEHTFFVCDRWTDERQLVESQIGQMTPENIVALMLNNENWWNRVAAYVQGLLRTKREDGCLTD